MKVAILVNRSANYGESYTKWKRIKDSLHLLKLNEPKVIEYQVPFNLQDCLDECINKDNIAHFISAGGDGSLNYLLNTLHKIAGGSLEKFTVGGIGLGSSNDFMKPVANCLQGVPVRVNSNNIVLHDVGCVRYGDENGRTGERLFLLNSSIGFLARGNYLFNKGGRILNFLKRKNVNLAINYTAIKTLFTHRPSELCLQSDKENKRLSLTSLSIVKNPHISGNFRFNQTVLPNDGFFGVNYCYNQNLFNIVETMADLQKGRFIRSKPVATRQSYLSRRLTVTGKTLEYLETDGEVTKAKNFEFSIHDKKINVMGFGY